MLIHATFQTFRIAERISKTASEVVESKMHLINSEFSKGGRPAKRLNELEILELIL